MRTMKTKMLVSAALALGGVGMSADAKATGGQCFTPAGDVSTQNTNLNPAVEACEAPEYLVSGSNAASLVVQDQISSAETDTYALEADSLNNTAIHAYAEQSTGYAIYAQNVGTGGKAIQASSTGDGVAIEGDSPTGIGVYGTSGGTGWAGVWGYNNATSTTTSFYGVYGDASTAGSKGIGVYGLGAEYGVYGDASGGPGVNGYSSGTGTAGVAGYASGSGSSGVYGECTSGTSCASGGGHAGYFRGDVVITGSLTVDSNSCCASDVRLKKNLQPLDGSRAIDQLLQLKGVTYEWKDPSAHDGDSGIVHGFVAQDVEMVFPSWVKQEGYTASDGKKYKTLELRQIEALEVESIRTLKTKNDALERRIDALENGRRPVVSGINLNGIGFGVGGLALAGAFMVVGRRKKDEERA